MTVVVEDAPATRIGTGRLADPPVQARALARVNEMTAGMHRPDRAGLVAFAEDAA